jgi:hypothetical protein
MNGTVDISSLLPGIYQVIWTTDGESALEKLVVQ